MINITGRTRTVLAVVTALGLAACGEADINSPGEIDQPDDGGAPPDGGGGGGGGGDTPPPPPSFACPTGTTESTPIGGQNVCEIAGAIVSDLTLVDGAAYKLSGRVDVGVDVGGDGSAAGGAPTTLTIEPGVTVFGAAGSDFLVVNRGSQLVANGTATQPITFTSQRQLEGTVTDTDRGLWGGLIVLGRAPINSCAGIEGGTAGCENRVEGTDAFYGGDQPNDNSGSLRFVRVLFAGDVIGEDNEINAITLGGVGRGTEIDFVQVHNNLDDGIEWFGGTVDVKHAVFTGIADDSIDWAEGWNGNLQFGLVVPSPDSAHRGIEADNLPDDPLKAPVSNPTISNVTFVGVNTGDEDQGILLRVGSDATILNSIVTGYNECLDIDSDASLAADPVFRSVFLDCPIPFASDSGETAAEVQAAFEASGDANNLVGEPNSLSARFFPGPVELGISAFDATTIDAFFDDVDYVGAFGPDETPDSNWASGWTFELFADPTCPQGTTSSGELNGQNRCVISGVVTGDLRLTRGNVYELDGEVEIGVDVGGDGAAAGGDPATLTIDSGVTIFGNEGSDFLVVNRGSRIFANGTATDPVVFTALNDLNGTQAPTDRGLWGGLIILGRAPINSCAGIEGGTAGCENRVEGTDAFYGGDQPDDDSGRLRFVRVQFAGDVIGEDNEINGITLGGVGRGTEIDFVQVHNNLDDGIEWFGGTVNLKHVVLTGIADDSIDWAEGWNGNLQFGLVVPSPDSAHRGIEADNLPDDPLKAPVSNPTISNVTFVGVNTGDEDQGILLRVGSDATILNSIVTGYNECLDIDSDASLAADPVFRSVFLDCPIPFASDSGETAAEVQAAFEASGDANNTFGVANTLSGFVNGATENGIAAFDPAGIDPFFDAVTWIGAVRDNTDNWWRGWTCGLEAGSEC